MVHSRKGLDMHTGNHVWMGINAHAAILVEPVTVVRAIAT
jgi:hypothetical protein